MTAIPSDRIRAMRMLTTAELVTRASALSEHGRELLIGTLAGNTDPIVRRAFIAALGGAEAGQGLTDEPRPAETQPEPEWVVWQQHWTGQWTEHYRGPENDARRYAQRAIAASGPGVPYLVLPEGQRPDEAVSQ